MSYDETLSEIAEVDPIAAMMWPWILTYFDDWGRAKASPREIKNSVFQANDLITLEVISKAITIFDGRLIEVYEVDGKPFMRINPDKWFKHQTHIRKEKRENDGSKHPAPTARDDAQVRADARDDAHFSDNLTDCIPSPSPSPSLKDTTTTEEVHRKVFGTMMMNGLMTEYVVGLKTKGYTDSFVQELMLETGEAGSKPSLRLMKSIGDRWIEEGIYTRVEAKRRKEESKGGYSRGPKLYVAKRDPELIARDIEIARNKWIDSGGDPSEFKFGHASND
jgi:hypothetical protein